MTNREAHQNLPRIRNRAARPSRGQAALLTALQAPLHRLAPRTLRNRVHPALRVRHLKDHRSIT